MSESFYSPTDISINSCSVVTTKSSYSLDFKTLIIEFNIYEDLFSNCMSGDILVSDSFGYINQMELDGQEKIFISFNTVGQNTPVEKQFRLYSISERASISRNSETYRIHFCSEELLTSQQMRISKTFNKKLISEIIKSICTNELHIPKEKLYIEPTVGVRDIIVPSFKPLQTINWLCSMSLSKNITGVGTTYIFYENFDGYFCRSLHGLYTQNIYRAFKYNVKNINSLDDPSKADHNREINNIIAYKIEKSFDSISNVQQGAFKNKTITFDPIRGIFGEKQFNYSEFVKESPTINSDSFKLTEKTDSGKTLNNSSSVVRFVVSNTGQSQNKYIRDKNISINENNIEHVLPYRTSQLLLLTNNKIKITISGDSSIRVGFIVNIDIPNLTEGSLSEPENKQLSGKYLITAIRHHYIVRSGYYTTMELCKDSNQRNAL